MLTINCGNRNKSRGLDWCLTLTQASAEEWIHYKWIVNLEDTIATTSRTRPGFYPPIHASESKSPHLQPSFELWYWKNIAIRSDRHRLYPVLSTAAQRNPFGISTGFATYATTSCKSYSSFHHHSQVIAEDNSQEHSIWSKQKSLDTLPFKHLANYLHYQKLSRLKCTSVACVEGDKRKEALG